MKGITPVIALVMLMLITVGMVGMAYTWFSNMQTTQVEKGVAIPPGGLYCAKDPVSGHNRINLIVQNAGATSSVSRSDIILLTIDGNSCDGAKEAGFDNTAPGGANFLLKNRDCGGSCAQAADCTATMHTVVVGTRTNVLTQTVICK